MTPESEEINRLHCHDALMRTALLAAKSVFKSHGFDNPGPLGKTEPTYLAWLAIERALAEVGSVAPADRERIVVESRVIGDDGSFRVGGPHK